MAEKEATTSTKSQMRKKKLKKIFTGIAVIFLSVLFTLLGLELLLRVVDPFRSHPGKKVFSAVTKLYKLSNNKNLVYELRPNSDLKLEKRGVEIKINAFGFRDKNYHLNKGDKKRIIFIGDSLTYGWSINLHETYHKQLEEMLHAKDYNTDVMGMGIVGYNTVQEYHLIKEKGVKFNPDIIVLQMCCNDFRRTLGIKKEKKGKNYCLIPYRDVAIPYVLAKSSFTRFLMRCSHLYKFINLKLEQLIKKWNKNYTVKEYFLMGEEKSFRYLKKIKKFLDEEGIKFCAVIFPNRKTREKYSYASLHKRIGNVLTNMHVPYIDLYREFNITGPGDIWADKSHPNGKGNRIAADTLLDFLLPMLR
ncbi:MAG: SGNH/GDSL hydrolase family protein [Candidatus Aminicenantes bacterium]|jgi:lysophospholipase L1-like esterase